MHILSSRGNKKFHQARPLQWEHDLRLVSTSRMTLLSVERPQDDAKTRLFRTMFQYSLREMPKNGSGRPLSVAQAALAANLSRPSVQTFHALACAAGMSPSDRVEISENAGYVFGVDLRETHPVRVNVCNSRGKELHLWQAPFDEKTSAGRAQRKTEDELLDMCFEGIVKCIDWLIAHHHVESYAELDDKLIGIGISIPGPVVEGVAVGPDAGPWRLVRADSGLAGRLGKVLPSFAPVESPDRRDQTTLIITRSDAYASAVTEYLWGVPEAAADFTIAVKWSVDLRASIITDGELYTGHNGLAGDLGHIEVNVDGSHDAPKEPPECRVCHEPRCLHAAASLEYLVSVAEETATKSGINTTSRPKSADLVEEVARATRADGSQMLTNALKVAASGIGTAVASYVAALDPETVVVGGAIGARIFDLVQESIKVPIARRAPRNARGIRIVGAKEKRNTTTRGAAACALLECGPQYLLWRIGR
jgi:predicted NBD/HSP70 family sugar kinase